MRKRQAKKIWLMQWNRVSPYWYRRLEAFINHERYDHRIAKAKKVLKQ